MIETGFDKQLQRCLQWYELLCWFSMAGNDIKNGDESLPFPDSYLDYYTETKMMQERVIN